MCACARVRCICVCYFVYFAYFIPFALSLFDLFGIRAPPRASANFVLDADWPDHSKYIYIYIYKYIRVCVCGGQILLYIDICIYKSGVHTWAKKRVAIRKLFFAAFVWRIGGKVLGFSPLFEGSPFFLGALTS